MRDGWEIKKLGHICTLQRGFDLPTRLRTAGVHPLVSSNGITDRINYWKIKAPGVVTGRSGSIGNVHFIEEDYWPLNTALYVKNFHDNHPRYIYYLLIQFNLARFSSGAGVPTLNRNHVHDEQVLFTNDIREQQRIVSILDEAFTAIDQAKENVERNLQNAKELFQSELNSLFTNKDDGWVEKKLKEIGETQTGNTPATSDKANYGDHIPFVKPAHFKTDGSIDSENSSLSKKGLLSARLFKANSILMVCIGATIGKTGYSEIPVTSNQQINALTPSKEFESKYFYYALITDAFFKKVIHASSQATLPIINKSKWENLTVPVPLEKRQQQKMVEQLDLLSVETKKLQEKYQQKLNALDDLKKSILEKAFKGELKEKEIAV